MNTMVNMLLVSRDGVNPLSISGCCSSSIERLIRPADILGSYPKSVTGVEAF